MRALFRMLCAIVLVGVLGAACATPTSLPLQEWSTANYVYHPLEGYGGHSGYTVTTHWAGLCDASGPSPATCPTTRYSHEHTYISGSTRAENAFKSTAESARNLEAVSRSVVSIIEMWEN